MTIMSSFRFNFSGNEINNHDNDLVEIEKHGKHEEQNWYESELIVPDKQIRELDNMVVHAKMFICGEVEIGHVITSDTMFLSISRDKGTNAVEIASKDHSDLITGIYEGGLKIWECTNDLIGYLSDETNDIKFENTNVLDLGCGNGILGVYAFMNGASVTFQDYNKEILEYVTIPNVLLNIEEEDREKEITKCKFYSGDWASFNKNLSSDVVYDFILTSETIYNKENYNKLIELLTKRLTSNGAVYVAAKSHYFGVGGGTKLFEESIHKNGCLKSELCWESTSGITREILKVTKIQQ